jgi:ribose transport system ATP-binding protein/rhamnose transport system ATP-binding protein
MGDAVPPPPRLAVRNVERSFPGILALKSVSLSVAPGEMHALLGENGAGKSTLGKLIGGVHPPSAGHIELDGMALDHIDETRAGELGIAIVHQEGSLVPQLSIAENIFAGRQPVRRFGTIDRGLMHRRARELREALGVALDPALLVRTLSTAQAQVIEIAKALSRELKLLILDEPTSALTLTETQRLFQLVRQLGAKGVAIIYVSHRLAAIFALCERVTVLKDGRVTGTRIVAQTSEDRLIRLVVGRDVLFARENVRQPGATVLELSGLAAPPFVRDSSLNVGAGVIVCLAGFIESGRFELCETVFGARSPTAGAIRLRGRNVRWTGPWDAMTAGVGMVPEDRKDAGLCLDQSIAANISATVLRRVSRSGLVSRAEADRLADRLIGELRIAVNGG